MLVLHGGVLGGRLHLWGEKPVESPPVARRPGRPRKRAPGVSFFKHDADLETLALAVSALTGEEEPLEKTWEIPQEEGAAAFAWLPVSAGEAWASSPLVGATPPAEATTTALAPFRVTALRIHPEEAVSVLSKVGGREVPAAGLVLARDLLFLSAVVRFAAALVAREQFLPGVVEDEAGSFRAQWEPVLSGTDTHRFSTLLAAMPPSCLALSRDPAQRPAAAGGSALTAFLASVSDQLVRSSIAGNGQGPARSSEFTEEMSSRSIRRSGGSLPSLHDRWVSALGSADGTLDGSRADLLGLAAQTREWRRPVSIVSEGPFRLSFRLEEPPAEGAIGQNGELAVENGSWHVRFLLQARDDPSLLVEAKSVWRGGRGNRVLERDRFNAREYLLSALGEAARIHPLLEKSLRSRAPAGCDLDSTAAYEFLSEKAWVLERAGFGVLLPSWWTGKTSRVRLSARALVHSAERASSGNGFSLDEIIHFDWQVALGDQPLTLEELQELAALKSPLVKTRGEWVELNHQDLQAALELWKNRGNRRGSVRDVMRLALGGGDDLAGLPVQGVSATGWVRHLLEDLEGKATLEELEPPAGFQGELRPYQRRGYSWLEFLRRWGLGSCLADDMGLGKTIQALALVLRDWQSGRRLPVLLVCPMSVVGNWQKEASRFAPELPVLVHHGLDRIKGSKFLNEVEGQALVISSYALAHRDLETLSQVKWGGVILDEAQNVKNAQTRQARAVRSLSAGYRIALTGTPVENNVGDLWSIFEFLNPGFLGSEMDFKRRFFIPIQAGRDPQAAQRLNRLIRPFVLRRLKTDPTIITDLPQKQELKAFCTLTREQASLYAAVVAEASRSIEEAEGMERRGLILATLTKLKQICNHPAHFLRDRSSLAGRSVKLTRLAEMLEEIGAAGERALVFTQFTEMGELLKRHLQETLGREVLFLHGGLSRKSRDELVERFQSGDPSRLPVFVLSLKAGGSGLNLTAANHVFHYDRWWNPAVENQATDRAFRIGQKRNVQVHKFICVGTVEERVDEMIERKKAIAGQVVGSGEAWLTELSDKQLRDLFTLRQEALGEEQP